MKLIQSTAYIRILVFLLYSIATIIFTTRVFAWGHDGHAAVGILSMSGLQPEARVELQAVLGSLDDKTIVEACNWPDAVRETDEWAWSYPLHFINIPQGESSYLQARDCPEHLCATEALKKYASQLGDRQLSMEKRQQAFAWVCHLTGDLHQPLHAGYAHDRGGNNFAVTFKGDETNLHSFWDRALIKTRAGNWRQLIEMAAGGDTRRSDNQWSEVMVNHWTEESHQLVEQDFYPQSPVIKRCYADKSWELLQQRISTAATRLALIVNTVL